ncbi:hypothetical protein F5Y13DRAFT_34754 [Hypoxylon sp. FL1857]|nr:hypothetical protein F5Y13DRAFT_34754 [Hypoxylon sp. FL1857]
MSQIDEERGPQDKESKEDLSQENIQQKPWKYIGYKGYAQFISSDSDLLIFREFEELNVRIALRLQDKISALEGKLRELDDSYSKEESGDINNGSFRDDMGDREAILNEIEDALNRYNKFLVHQSRMRQFPRAPIRDVKNIKRWHQNHANWAINEDEHSYLDQDDLVCLKRKDKVPLRQLIDNSLRLRTLSIWRDKSHATPQGSENVSYFSDEKMNVFVSAVITFIGTALLIVPLWILQTIEDSNMKLVVITVFIFVFLSVLSSVLVTKPFEALGATAAYAAVLMVFLQVGQD